MTGPIAMGGQKITGAAGPTENQDVATKAYVDGEIANVGGTYLPLAGGTMTGPVEMGNNKITGLATPTENTDAATKAYVDDLAQQSGNYLPIDGGTMSGDIDMGNNSITSLNTPSDDAGNPSDAINRLYAQNFNNGYSYKLTNTVNAGDNDLFKLNKLGFYLGMIYLGISAGSNVQFNFYAKYSDGQKITYGTYSSKLNFQTMDIIVKAPCTIGIESNNEFTGPIGINFIFCYLGLSADGNNLIKPAE